MAKSNRQLLITLGADTTTFSQKVKRAKDLTKELDSNFKMLSSSSKNFENSLEGLGSKQKYLNDKIDVATTLSKTYNTQLKDQQERLNNSKESMEKLAQELKDLKEVQSLAKETKEWEDWQREIDATEKELEQVTKETRTFQNNIISLNTSINKNQTNIAKMNSELAETKLKMQMVAREKVFESMQQDITETERKFENVERSVDGFGDSVTGLTAKKKHLNTQMEKTNRLMTEYAKDIDKSKKEMQEMKSTVYKLTNEVNGMQKAVDKMDGTEKHYERMTQELERLRAKLSSSNKILDMHEQKVKENTNAYKQSENSLNSMRGSLKQVDAQLKQVGKNNQFKTLENALESVRHEFELMDSKLEVLRSSYVNFENSMLGAMRESKMLKQQTQQLRQEYSLQQTTIEQYKQKLTTLTTEYDKLGRKIKESKNSLKHMTEGSDEYNNTIAKISAMEKEYSELDNEIKDVTNSLRQMKVESNNTLTNINNNIKSQHRGWEVLSNKIQSVGNAFTTAGNSLQSLGGSLMPITVGVTALGTAVVKTGKEFQEGMDKASAVMGASTEEVEKLTDKARTLASESRWCASDVADAYNYMGMAGWSAGEALEGVYGVMQLASAGATDLATTSDIVTDGLTSMKMKAEDTTRFVDIMSATMVNSNTNIEMMGETLKYAGNVAGGLGITMEDLSLAIGTMANAGIKASMSGTSLRGGLTRLIAPTEKAEAQMKKYGVEVKKNKDGNIDLRATMENLRKTLGKLDKDTQNAVAKVIFGQTAMNGWLSIINADEEAFNDLAKSIDSASASNGKFTETLEKKMNDNLAGDLRTLKSTLEESFLTLFDEIEPYLREFAQGLTTAIKEVTKWFSGLDDATQRNIVKFVALAGVIAPVASVLGFLLSGVGTTITTFGKLVGISGKVITKFNLLKGSGVTLKGLFTNFGGTVKTLSSTMKGNLSGALSGVTKLFGGGAGLSGVLGSLTSVALPALAVALGGLGVIFGDNEQALSNLIDKFGWFGTALSGASEVLNGAFKSTFGQFGNILSGIGGTAKSILTGNFKDIDDVWSETFSKMKTTASESWENITMNSTRSINKLRKYTEKDVAEIKTVFEDTYSQISNVTSTNLENVAQNITDMFTDSRGKSLSLASETIDILRGTSDTMRILFSGVKSEMDIDVAKARFTENLTNLLNTGGTTAEELAKDFEKAWATIDKNIIDGGERINSNASKILDEFNEVASGKIDKGVDDIVGILDDLDVRGIESLRNIGTNWNSIFAGISTDSKMTTEEMKNAILKNIETLGLDTPEKLAEFKKSLQYEMEIASEQAKSDGTEVGESILEGVETGVTEGVESTGENIKEATKTVTEQATTGAKEGFEELPSAVKQELEKAGVSIDEQGNVIVTDMAKKGKEGAKAYVDEMNRELPKINGVAGTIQKQLNGINKVKFGGVTKQLSQINKWLGDCMDSAVKTGASLAEMKTVTFGSTTKGLSEVNKWLDEKITPSAKNVKNRLQEITKVTYGSTTKGLSEINKWLKEKITPSATTAHSKLLTLSRFTFSGVVSGLKSVNSWLTTIKNNANGAKSAIVSVSNASKSAKTIEVQTVSDVGMENYSVSNFARESTQEISMARFKTSGGFYEPQQVVLATPQATATSTSSNDALLKIMLEQNQMLLQLLNQEKPIDVAINVDGKQIAKASAKYMNEQIEKITKRKNRLGGVIV